MNGLLDLALYYLPLLGVAMLIGIATARWAFSRPPAPAPDGEKTEDKAPS